jgi:ABC-type uncharacterized transport system substrate-binding protein
VDRRRFLLTSLAGALAAPLTVEAQQAGKVARVGVLYTGSSTESADVQREPFERGLRDPGWTPRSNIIVDYRYGEGNVERLTSAAVELARGGVDVFVARGNAAIRSAERASETAPIVMSSADDPVGAGFVKNLARPGGRITGIANLVTELDGKRLELLKEAIPGLRRVAVLVNPTMGTGRYQRIRTHVNSSAHALGLDSQMFEVTRLDELASAFDAMNRTRAEALLVLADTIILEPSRARLVTMVANRRMPAMYPWHFYTDAGGLMSYSTSIPAFHYRSAVYVDKILKGAKPAELPVEQPTKFELVVNLKTAKALGLTIPPSLLLRADQVIE